MKKVFMSLVAVAVMSSAAFADSGEKVPVEKSVRTANSHTSTVGKNYAKAMEEVKKNRDGKAMVQSCRYTLKVYNAQGEYQFSHVINGVVSDDLGGYTSCDNFFARMRKAFSAVYDIN